MRKVIMLAMATLAFLQGCGYEGGKPANAPAAPKWKAPYHIEFETKAPKPNPSGISLPDLKYTGNPQALERRASLIVRFDASTAKSDQPANDQMIMAAVDLPGTGGTLPADYMDLADKGLAKLLGAYCMKGTVKLNVALVRSSIKPQATDAEIDSKRLTEWLPIQVDFKNPHPKCKAS